MLFDRVLSHLQTHCHRFSVAWCLRDSRLFTSALAQLLLSVQTLHRSTAQYPLKNSPKYQREQRVRTRPFPLVCWAAAAPHVPGYSSSFWPRGNTVKTGVRSRSSTMNELSRAHRRTCACCCSGGLCLYVLCYALLRVCRFVLPHT